MDIPNKVQSVLDILFPNPPVPLDNSSDFTFLVAVVLSAQTTDGKVNEVTKVLFKHADNPYDMAKLDVLFVLDTIRSVGLAPKKAENIIKLSKMLVEKFGGKVPATYEELESLPGVGHKTASVMMSQLHNIPSIAVDTHVHRLALRWGLSKDQKNVDNVQRDLCRIFPEDCWNKLHLQMIYFGREYCTAKNHVNSECPVCSWIHTKACTPPRTFHQFDSKKPAKGIVYYADRLREVKANPSIVFCSPEKATAVVVPAVKNECLDSGSSLQNTIMPVTKSEPNSVLASITTTAIESARVTATIKSQAQLETNIKTTRKRKQTEQSLTTTTAANTVKTEMLESPPLLAVPAAAVVVSSTTRRSPRSHKL